MLETQLGRGFLPDVSPPSVVPLGSPALQRKSGYRELLHFWLQFHAGAQLVWEGSADVFEAGARNVATLYEYWLFFGNKPGRNKPGQIYFFAPFVGDRPKVSPLGWETARKVGD